MSQIELHIMIMFSYDKFMFLCKEFILANGN